MLVVAGHVRIDPANAEKAQAAVVGVMEETRNEPGCISYVFSADLSEPGVYRIFEEWESAEALAAHFEAAHMATFQATVGGLGVLEMDVKRYDVSAVGPVRG